MELVVIVRGVLPSGKIMHTFADLAKALNRSTVYLSGLQSRFELPPLDGAGHLEAYLAFRLSSDGGAFAHPLDHRRNAAGSVTWANRL